MEYDVNGTLWYGSKDPDDSDYCGDSCYWRIEDDTLIFTGDGELVWRYLGKKLRKTPSEIRGQTYSKVIVKEGIEAISKMAFWHQNIESVRLPNSMVNIGDWAFRSCESLTNLVVPGNIPEKGRNVFADCAPLNVVISEGSTEISGSIFLDVAISSIVIPDSVTRFGRCAFNGCIGLTSITIPESVAEIGDFAFARCQLTKIVIPGTVKKIGAAAFIQCKDLTEVVIENGVTEICKDAFHSCTSLKALYIPRSVSKIGTGLLYGCQDVRITVDENNEALTDIDGVLFSKDKKKLLLFYRDFTEYTVPDGVEVIGECAFDKCRSLISITLPASVSVIGEHAFCECNMLQRVSFLESDCESSTHTIEIRCGAFLGCHSLRQINLPENVVEIGGSAFYRCRAMTGIVIPDKVTSIEDDTFFNCLQLETIELPDGITSIGGGAFEECWNLKSVTIPNSVTKVGYRAFHNCDELKEVIFKGTRKEWEQLEIEDFDYPLCDVKISFQPARRRMINE